MGRRNWCKVFLDVNSGDLVFDMRVEKEKGIGTTVGCVHGSILIYGDTALTPNLSYVVKAPAPRWQ